MDAPATPPLLPVPAPAESAARPARAVAWVVALMAAVHFLEWTVFLPEDVQGALGFRRGDLDLGRWWGVFTYPFVHADLASLLLGGYALGTFGTRLERAWGTRRFLALGLLAAAGAWALHLFVGGRGVLLGSGAWAFAALTAHAMQFDDAEHPLAARGLLDGRWMALFTGALLLLVGLRQEVGGGGAFVAHLAGIGAAWLFVRATQVTFVDRFREGVSALPDEPPEDQPTRAVPRTLPRSRARERETIDDVVARTNASATKRTPPPPKQAPKESPSERRRPPAPDAADARDGTTGIASSDPPPTIDAILDKISAEGMDHLTEVERRVLDEHSRRLRDG